MKKLIALLLVATAFFSFAACGNTSGENDSTTHNIYIKKGENGINYIVFPNSKVIGDYVVKVEITKDNWHEYFEDYEYTEHVVRTNDFGDVEEEYDEIHFGFGLKQNLLGCVDKVSFKFDGKTDIYYNNDGTSIMTHNVFKANQSTYSVYNHETNEIISEEALDDDEIEEYYLLELQYSEKEDAVHFEEHKCIDAIGTLYLINLPEGIYNGEDVEQIEWASGGCASICVSNLERYAEN